MDDKQSFKALIEEIVSQAEYLLSEMGEFYPFGCIVEKSGLVKTLGLHYVEDNPTSQALIEIIEKIIIEGIKDGTFLSGAIGIDGYLNPDSLKVNSLEIRTMESDKIEWGYIYLPYQINNKIVKFGDFQSF